MEQIMKKYYITSKYKLLYSLIGLLELIPNIALLFLIRQIPFINIIYLLLIGYVIVRVFYRIKDETITISDTGIEYNTPGTILEINWENIYKISYCWRRLIKQECLVIDQSYVKIERWAVDPNSYPTLVENHQKNIAIPLSCFSDGWRNSELGQQIKQYAPRLFEKEKSA
jgi:hypothetical protein